MTGYVYEQEDIDAIDAWNRRRAALDVCPCCGGVGRVERAKAAAAAAAAILLTALQLATVPATEPMEKR